MTRRKTEVRPENVGRYFMDTRGGIVQLVECQSEPQAKFELIHGDFDTHFEGGVSTFNLALLKPSHSINPIENVKKARADKGKSHRKKKEPPTNRIGDIRICPTHQKPLKAYADGLWCCIEEGCEYEEREIKELESKE